jgi:hypothetical protein
MKCSAAPAPYPGSISRYTTFTPPVNDNARPPEGCLAAGSGGGRPPGGGLWRRPAPGGGAEQPHASLVLGEAGGGHDDGQEQAEGAGDDAPLAADLLGGVGALAGGRDAAECSGRMP